MEKIRHHYNLKKRLLRARESGNRKQAERFALQYQAFQIESKTVMRVAEGVLNAHELAVYVDNRQRELGQSQTIAFRRSYAFES